MQTNPKPSLRAPNETYQDLSSHQGLEINLPRMVSTMCIISRSLL